MNHHNTQIETNTVPENTLNSDIDDNESYWSSDDGIRSCASTQPDFMLPELTAPPDATFPQLFRCAYYNDADGFNLEIQNIVNRGERWYEDMHYEVIMTRLHIVHYAAIHSFQCLNILVKQIVTKQHRWWMINCATRDGMTPLHYAVAARQQKSAWLLLIYGANINAWEHGLGNTPLDLAAQNNDADMIDMLLSCCKSIGLRGGFSETAVCLATDINVTRRLLRAGASPNASYINPENGWLHETVMHRAAREGEQITFHICRLNASN